MGMIYLIDVPANTPVPTKATAEQIKSSKSGYGYPYTYTREKEDENTREIVTEEVHITRDDAIKSTINLAQATWRISPNRDSWIVEKDGTILAVVRCRFTVEYVS